MVDSTAADGRPWTTVAPATAQLVAGRVQALLNGLIDAQQAAAT